LFDSFRPYPSEAADCVTTARPIPRCIACGNENKIAANSTDREPEDRAVKCKHWVSAQLNSNGATVKTKDLKNSSYREKLLRQGC